MEVRLMKPSLLFLENTVPEYRVQFYQAIGERYNTTFFFTNLDQNHLGNLRELSKGGAATKVQFTCRELMEKAKEVDVVAVAADYRSIRSWVFLLYLRLIRKPTLIWNEVWWWPEHGFWRLSRLVRFFLLFLVTKFSGFFAVPGSLHREYLMKCGVAKERIWIVPYTAEHALRTADVSIFDPKIANWLKSDRRVLYLARVEKVKGCDLLLKAFGSEEELDACLLVAGSGSFLGACQRLAKQLKLTRTYFSGRADSDLRSFLMENCSVYVLPSRHDAYAVSVVEAVSHHKPILVSDGVGSYPDVVHGNGLVFEHCNVEDLREKLETLLESDLDVLEFNSEKVAQQFTLDRSVDMMSQAIQQALSQGQREGRTASWS
jgi:glycosyltransferase involved in cell wall biosynthesis